MKKLQKILTPTNSSIANFNQPPVLTDNQINEKICSLNEGQRKVFNVILTWAVEFAKNRNCNMPAKIEPLHIFLTGKGGTGKSHLVKVVFHTVSKVLLRKGSDPEKKRVLLLAPTGVAAVNIGGTTIHSALGIFGLIYAPLSDRLKASLRNKLGEVTAVIIDEISMVSSTLLKDVHLRLCEIFGVSTNIPFAGKTVIAVGDFYQLPPVMGKPVYSKSGFVERVLYLWGYFKIAELTEVMRQQGDNANKFIDLLNNVRVDTLTEADEELLQSKFISKNDANYPLDALHLYAENNPVTEHNKMMLAKLDGTCITINAIDQVPKDIPQRLIEQMQQRKVTDTGGLEFKLTIKIGAKVMLTINLDIEDKLINGQIGRVTNIAFKNNQVSKIYVKFFDEEAGLNRMRADRYALQHRVCHISSVLKQTFE